MLKAPDSDSGALGILLEVLEVSQLLRSWGSIGKIGGFGFEPGESAFNQQFFQPTGLTRLLYCDEGVEALVFKGTVPAGVDVEGVTC